MNTHEEWLLADFEQSFEQVRHYDDTLATTSQFGYGAVVTVLGASAWLIAQYGLKPLTATAAGCLLLISAIAGSLLLFSLGRQRVYFVRVARFVNEVRSHYLTSRPLNVANSSHMYVDPHYPPVFHSSSAHTMAVGFFALCNSLLASVGVVAINAASTLSKGGQPDVPWVRASLVFAVLFVIEASLVVGPWIKEQSNLSK